MVSYLQPLSRLLSRGNTACSLQPCLERIAKEFLAGKPGVWEILNCAPAALPEDWIIRQIIARNAKNPDKLILIYKERCKSPS